MAEYSVNRSGRIPVLIRWDCPDIWTFDPRVEGEWRLSPEKASMFCGEGDFTWYDDITEEGTLRLSDGC